MKIAEMLSLGALAGYGIRVTVYTNISGLHNENFKKNFVAFLTVTYKPEG
jgi:hypothetical protein